MQLANEVGLQTNGSRTKRSIENGGEEEQGLCEIYQGGEHLESAKTHYRFI